MDALYDKLTAILERLDELGRAIRAHHLFPNRKVVYGFVSGLVTTVTLKLGFDLNDPVVAYLSPLVVGYVVSWLVTEGAAVEHHDDEQTIEAEEKALVAREQQTAPDPEP